MIEYAVIQKPHIHVIGIECRTSNAVDAGPRDIPQLWGRFFNEGIVQQIPNKVSEQIIALYCDYEGDYTKPYTFVIGCPVHSIDAIPIEMVAKTLPATAYAQISVIGEYPKNLIQTWGEIWQSNLPRSYAGDMEIYGEKFHETDPKQVEVLIALENK